jgi:hypothetical protein
MIETLDDILQELGDAFLIFRVHYDDDCESKIGLCRRCWVARLRRRIENALEVERKLTK